MEVLKNCEITHQDSKILQMFKSSEILGVESHDGIDISGDRIYSICYGVVAEIYPESPHFHVAIQYNDDILIRYCNLSKVDVYIGQPVYYGQLIGLCDKYIHFEYCTPVAYDSSRTVRVAGLSYIKADPWLILTNRSQFVPDFRDGTVPIDTSQYEVAYEDEITAEVVKEFTGNKGD